MGFLERRAQIRAHSCIAWVLIGIGCIAGCSGGKKGDTTGAKPPSAPDVEPPDELSNGLLTIDEDGLHGDMQAQALQLSIPVKASEAARGTFDVTLSEVDGKKISAHAAVAYDLRAGDEKTLKANIALPEAIKAQSDLMGYKVRVEQKGAYALRVTKSLAYVLAAYDVQLEGPAKLRSAKKASYRVKLMDPRTREPRADEIVQLALVRDDEEILTLDGTTDESGSAVFEVEPPDAGDYQVLARSVELGPVVELVEAVNVEAPGKKVLLTTDKPIYQPGQVIQLRALALENPSNMPLAGQEVVFEVEDGKGNKVLKKKKKSDEYGIASTRFALASVVNMGAFTVRALLGDAMGQKSVEVSRYALPKFDVALGADKAWYRPGQTVEATIDARYFFGKQVAGASVVVEAITLDVGAQVFARVMGMTGNDGKMSVKVKLPATLAGIPLQDGNALVTLRATVTDTADQEVTKELPLTVAAQAVRISLVPEATLLVPGVENRLHLFATDPLGAPVEDAEVSIGAGTAAMSDKTDAFGHAQAKWTPEAADATVAVALTTAEGEKVAQSFSFGAQQGGEHVLVRTDKSVYALGETVLVQVFASNHETRVYLDWLNEGQAVAMSTLDVDKNGTAKLSMPLDASLIGENRIEAYVVDEDGNTVRAGRTIVVNREGSLHVALDADQDEYRPGQAAKLTLSVTDEQGKPAVAALGVQIVDEAVFGLIDARPGLLRTFFELEDSFATPQYEIEGPIVNFEQLLFDDAHADDEKQAAAAQTKAEASLAALRGRSMMGIHATSWQKTLQDGMALLVPYYGSERTRLLGVLKPLAASERDALEREGCTPTKGTCDGLGFAPALAKRIGARVSFVDFWGNPYAQDNANAGYATVPLMTRGPDEIAGNADDYAISIGLADLGIDVYSGSGKGADAGVPSDDAHNGFDPCAGGCAQAPGNFGNMGGAAGNGGAGAPPVLAGSGGSTGGAPQPTVDGEQEQQPGVRVRREFPETLYTNPSLITDQKGKATISLDMADSITEWRVSAMANSLSGKLGGGQAGVTVFQDFFVDVNFPAELTRGDEVEFPIVLYNYLKESQTVQLELEAGDWFTALGSTTASVELQPGQVSSIRFPVRVESVGSQTLTVHATGSSASDAVARSVRVVPDGLAVPLAQSGSLPNGDKMLDVSFPANAVPGSEQLYLDVFPAFLSSAVSGLDSMLQEPNGCFEQTTSTTWPNVLVTHYMEQTGQTTPEIQLKAESLISAGYQRLLTFEHQGGGFSWFGEQDPAPFLSVTAFGLMEFADMASVQEVDAAMLDRTKTWLASQQTADGSWAGDQSEFFTFHTSALRNTAFTVWALSSAGYTGPEVQRGLDFVAAHLDDDESDAYTIALVANAFAAAAPGDERTTDLIERVEDKKQTGTDGKIHWDAGETQTCFYGGGDDAAVTATALAAHALLTAGGHASTVAGALEYLTGMRDAQGNFGSTQATVWTLKTLLLAALKGTEGAVGTFAVELDGQSFAEVELTKDQADVMTRVDMSALAATGDHVVNLSFDGKGKVSYNLVSRHHVPWAQVQDMPTGPLSVEIAYDRTSLPVDETVASTVSVQNLTATSQNMILVTLGIPPGFEVLTEDLTQYLSSNVLSHFEKTGKQLTLYMTALGPNATQAFTYRLRATMPVRAVDGGAVVYPYYEPDQKSDTASTMIVATAE